MALPDGDFAPAGSATTSAVLATGGGDPVATSRWRRLVADDPDNGSGRDWCFDRRTRQAGLLLGPVVVVVTTLASSWARGPLAYPVAWAATGAVFVLPATVFAGLVRRRSGPIDRAFWTFWLAGQASACAFGACLLVQRLDPSLLHAAGTAFLAIAACLWGSGLVYLVSRTDGARILAIDALEILVADLAVVAPVLILAAPRLADARASWYADPAAAAAAGLPLVAALTITLCVRLPARERSPELIGAMAAVLGEADALLQAAQGTDGFRLPPAPLIAVQGITMWLLLLLVLHAHRKFPEGLSRLSPDAQVRRWSLLPLLVVASVPALAVEAVTAPAGRPWVVPAVVAVLGTVVVLMTVRHLLVVNETGRLHRQLAIESEERHLLLDDLVQAVEDDRHRVLAQLHELAVEWMAAIGAVQRTCRTGGADREIVVGALGRIYADVGGRAESLRRLMQAVRPPAFHGEGLRTAVVASTSSIFGNTRAPVVDVHIEDGIDMDWTTSTIVYRLILESLRSALGRSPVSHVVVTVDGAGNGGALRVIVIDDAQGSDPLAGSEAPRLTALQLFADLGHGSVDVSRRTGGGARVCATLGGRR